MTSDDLDKIVKDSSRTLAFSALMLSVMLIFVIIGGSVLSVAYIGNIHKQEKSDCSFYSLISDIPVISKGPEITGKVGVELVEDSRSSFVGKGCGVLPPPSSDLVKLGSLYGIQITPLNIRRTRSTFTDQVRVAFLSQKEYATS